jgi:3-methyladenine DNA glycosylase AlkD
MDSIIQQVRSELLEKSSPQVASRAQGFFKEKLFTYGAKTPDVQKIAKKYWSQVQKLSKVEVLRLCEELFSSGYVEDAFVVADWMPNMVPKLAPEDLTILKKWIEKYINNWASCDSFCNHTIGDFLKKYPESVLEVASWAKSTCRWLKRASAVSLILPARRGDFLKEVFAISDTLLLDEDDLVQKGYGWLLKEASRLHQKEVFDYVVKNREVMPRTALRYAIELMPKDLKAEAMKKY